MKRLISICALATFSFCHAGNTKGLNQIVTPDVQPFGQLSLSFQAEHSALGNPFQVQYELGLDKRFEAAVFQGVDPGQLFFATEVGLIQQKEFLLSAGFVNWSTRGTAPQEFLEGGYYKGNVKVVAGLQRIGRANDPIVGGAYQVTPSLLAQADYMGGRENYSTVGVTYSATPTVSVNPALYIANATGHKLYPFVVVSWSVTAFK